MADQRVELVNNANDVTIALDGNSGIVFWGTDAKQRLAILKDDAGVVVGGNGTGGDIHVYPANATLTTFAGFPTADASKATILLIGETGNIVLQTGGKPTIRLDGQKADLFLGGGGQHGAVTLREGATGKNTIFIDGKGGNLYLGGNGIDGDLVLYPSSVANAAAVDMSAIHLSAEDPIISLRGGGRETVRIDGKIGDVVLANADGAEEFEIDEEVGPVEPGCVLVIGDESRLRLADRPYDRRVAGIVSGANGLRPGIVLGRSPDGRRVPLALFGKVNCKVDATETPVLAGDLLTTSQTLGYAMRAEPDERATGALIGKALRGLEAGRDLIPVLVSLH